MQNTASQPRPVPETSSISITLASQTSEILGMKLLKYSTHRKHIDVSALKLSALLQTAPTQTDILLLECTDLPEQQVSWIQQIHQASPKGMILVYTLDPQAPIAEWQEKLPFVTFLSNANMLVLYQGLEDAIHKQLQVKKAHITPLRLAPKPNLSPSDEENMFFKRNKPQPPQSEPEMAPQPSPSHTLNPPIQQSPQLAKEYNMSSISQTLESALSTIDGATAAALVEYNSGMMLGSAGGGVNLELAAAGNTDVVKAKMRTMQSLGISGSIEDILITLDNQYHIIYLVPGQTLFLYLVLQKDRANLALARYKLKALGADLKV